MSKKIFIDCSSIEKMYHGSRSYLVEITKYLMQNPSLRVYIGCRDKDVIRELLGNSANNVVYCIYQYQNTFLKLHIDVRKIIKSNGIDYAVFQYFAPLGTYCKYLITVHDILFCDYPAEYPFMYRLARTLYYKSTLKRAFQLLTVSEYSKGALHRHFDIPLSKISVTPNAVGSQYFTFNHSKAESRSYVEDKFSIKNYILYVSRIEPRKNHARLLEAYLHSEAYKSRPLVFVGATSIKSGQLEEILSKNEPRLKNKLYQLSEITDADLMHLYNAADCFIYPSNSEGFGIPPIEAAVLKVPVICSGQTAMADFTFFAPYLINPDTEHIRQALDRILMHPPAADKMEQIRQQVVNTYNWEKSAEVIVSLIEQDENTGVKQ